HLCTPSAAPCRLSRFSSRRHRDHRALHSFPTRRSSDLPHSPADGADRAGLRLLRFPPPGLAGEADLHVAEPHPGGDRHTVPLGRSEEHTSELQSRENLVCRLLLEKKKKKIRTEQARKAT